MARRSAGVSFVLLDRDLRIRAASTAYEQVTLRESGELPGQFLFDAFPDDPADPQANGTSNLADSLETVMRSGQTHTMRVQRYDIRDPADPDRFLPKVWNPTNSPLFDDGELVGVVHVVEEVSESRQLLDELARAVDRGEPVTPAELLHTFAAISAAEAARHLQLRQALVDENEHLRHAIETRDTIGQAKGMLMERFHVDAAAAFEMLAKVSQNGNIPVEQIARRVIEIDHPERSS